MKYNKIKTMSDEEKAKLLADSKMSLLKLNLQVSTGTSLKKTKEIRELKRDIAKIKTSIREKTLTENKTN